jgi:hypothetical protein
VLSVDSIHSIKTFAVDNTDGAAFPLYTLY